MNQTFSGKDTNISGEKQIANGRAFWIQFNNRPPPCPRLTGMLLGEGPWVSCRDLLGSGHAAEKRLSVTWILNWTTGLVFTMMHVLGKCVCVCVWSVWECMPACGWTCMWECVWACACRGMEMRVMSLCLMCAWESTCRIWSVWGCVCDVCAHAPGRPLRTGMNESAGNDPSPRRFHLNHYGKEFVPEALTGRDTLLILLVKSLKMPVERSSGGNDGRGCLKLLNQTSKCYSCTSVELGPKRESAYDIYISNLQSLISFDSYLFIYLQEKKERERERNLNQTERHRSKTFECSAKLINTGSWRVG